MARLIANTLILNSARTITRVFNGECFGMFYEPGTSTILSCLDPIEAFAIYCLGLEAIGNKGSTDLPPVAFEQYKGICFYDAHRRRKRDPKIFWLYKNWREVFAERYPDCPLMPELPRKPKESLSESHLRDLLMFYMIFYDKATGGNCYTRLEWYAGQYYLHLQDLSLSSAEDQYLKFPTRKAVRAFLVEELQKLISLRRDWFLYNVFKDAMAEMYRHYMHCQYYDHATRNEMTLQVLDLTEEVYEISFPTRDAAAAWFKSQITLLEAWGIKPKTPAYKAERS